MGSSSACCSARRSRALLGFVWTWRRSSIVQAFQAFLQRPPQSTRDWAKGRRVTNPKSGGYVAALKQDRQSWLLVETYLRAALAVTPCAGSIQGLHRIPVQGWDR